MAPESHVSVRLMRTFSSGISTLMGGSEVADLHHTNGPVGSAEDLSYLPAGFYAGVVVVLVVAGSLSLFPLWLAICRLWAADPLRSIGAAFPLVAGVGVLAAWRRQGWSMNGTFWALPVVALSILLARTVAVSSFIVGYRGQRLSLVNFGTALFLYGIGAVLLFGGTRLLRASIFPLCLLLFINPLPYVFNSVVDLPLQHLSASTARSFAHFIGLQPTGAQLRVMFAPDFGMFIAPGCNGVRGSITLGFLTLIFGYARRLRPLTLACVTLAAFLLGYALNLLRLCVLVVYYWIGLSFPSIQKHGVGVDYAIGGALFLFATLGIGLLIRSLTPSPLAGTRKAEQRREAEMSRVPPTAGPLGYATAARALCFLALTLVCAVAELRSTPTRLVLRPNEQAVLNSFPASVGPYRLTRSWAEHSYGMVALAMAEYSASPGTGDTANNLTFGLWVGSANHLIAESRFAQGQLARWNGSFDAIARQAMPVHFVTSFYDDSISRQYDAESVCSRAGCASPLTGSSHEGFFFKAPAFSDLALAPRGKRLPILLRREWPASDPTPSVDLRSRFEADARLFLAQVDLRQLLLQDGSQF